MPEQAELLEQLRLMSAGITSAHLRLPQPVRASTPQHAWKSARPDGTGTSWKRMIGIFRPVSGVFRIWRNFWRNRARNFSAAPCSARSWCYRRVGTSSSAAKPVAIAKAAGKPVIRLKMDLCVRWILASMASRRFLCGGWLWHLLRCQQAFSTGETVQDKAGNTALISLAREAMHTSWPGICRNITWHLRLWLMSQTFRHRSGCRSDI